MIRKFVLSAALCLTLPFAAAAQDQPAPQHILQLRNGTCGPITITTSNPTLCKKAPCTTAPIGQARFINLPLNLNSGESSVELQINGACDGSGPIQGTCALTLGRILPGYSGVQDPGMPYRKNFSDGTNLDYGDGTVAQDGPNGGGVEGEPDPSLAFMSRNPSPVKSNNINVSVRITACESNGPGQPRICKAVCGSL